MEHKTLGGKILVMAYATKRNPRVEALSDETTGDQVRLMREVSLVAALQANETSVAAGRCALCILARGRTLHGGAITKCLALDVADTAGHRALERSAKADHLRPMEVQPEGVRSNAQCYEPPPTTPGAVARIIEVAQIVDQPAACGQLERQGVADEV